jgi:3-oxoacyl-[acyl-carrier protein] reductase
MLAANMLTPIALMKATVDAMAERGHGRVININSGAVKAPIEGLDVSDGARSGLTGFVAGLAGQSRLASRNVTLNNLLPGSFDTDRIRATDAAAAQAQGREGDAVQAEEVAAIPARRLGRPEELGALCAFACSVQMGHLTGRNLLLDGGACPGAM